MTKEEYIKNMQALGWTDNDINAQLELHEKAAKEGIHIPLELDLIERPIAY